MSARKGPLILGLDLGTTGAKAGVLDLEGRLLASASSEYPTAVPEAGWAEQDPADWWSSTCNAIGEAVSASGRKPSEIVSVGVSGQMHGSVFLDNELEVIRPCILWCDQRTSPQCALITDLVGRDVLATTVGNAALEGFTAPKILWLRDEEPAGYERLRHILLPKDYINLRLTGEVSTEASDASGTLLFDVAKRQWSTTVIDRLKIDRDMLPEVTESSSAVGTISAEAARATGLAAGTLVAAGGADNACGAIGMGVVSEGHVAVSIGSSGTVLAPTSSPAVDPEMRLHSFCHAVPRTWYLMGVMLSAGLSLRWFRDELGEPEVGEARRTARDPYELLDATAAAAPPGCEGLVFLPYMSGERTPHADPDARGVLFGLDLSKRRSHVVRAVMEGVTFALKDSMGLMRELGLRMETVTAGGGGSRSRLWRQMQADVFELPVRAAGLSEAAMLGAALLGGVAAGAYASIAEACGASVRYGETAEPDPDTFDACRGAYRTYRELYPALRPIFGE